MRVGWAYADCNPGHQLGSDEYTWAFDGYNVSISLCVCIAEVIISNYTHVALFADTTIIII